MNKSVDTLSDTTTKMFVKKKQKLTENDKNQKKRRFYRTVFSEDEGKVEIHAIEEHNPRNGIKFNKMKKVLLIVIICALTLTVLSIVIQQFIINNRIDSILSHKEKTDRTDSPLNSVRDKLIDDIPKEMVTQNTALTPYATIITTQSPTTRNTTTEATTPTTTELTLNVSNESKSTVYRDFRSDQNYGNMSEKVMIRWTTTEQTTKSMITPSTTTITTAEATTPTTVTTQRTITTTIPTPSTTAKYLTTIGTTERQTTER